MIKESKGYFIPFDAMSGAEIAEFERMLNYARGSREIKVAVNTGEGERVFNVLGLKHAAKVVI